MGGEYRRLNPSGKLENNVSEIPDYDNVIEP